VPDSDVIVTERHGTGFMALHIQKQVLSKYVTHKVETTNEITEQFMTEHRDRKERESEVITEVESS
jgi:hypothetical protein